MQKREEGRKLQNYIKGKGWSVSDTAENKLGMTRQNLGVYFTKDKLSDTFLLLLKEKLGIGFADGKFFDINEDKRYSTPEGLSVVNEPLMETSDVKVVTHGKLMWVPVVPERAVAGYLTGYHDREYIETLEKHPWLVDKEYKGTYLTFTVSNDSMNDGTIDGYREGDKVLGREIPRDLWRDRLHLHRWSDYIVVLKRDGIVLKRITEHDIAKGIITLHSLNPMYEDYKVRLDDVAQLFNVVQIQGRRGS
jgi:hypothetical protein